jgi:hypothetical protein
MENFSLTLPKESAGDDNKSQDNADVFLDCSGITHRECFPPSLTANQKFYIQVLETLERASSLCEARTIARKVLLHHDNAPSHTALSIKEFFGEQINRGRGTTHFLTRSRSV